MIELIKQKRVRDKFKHEFGASMDDFFDDVPITAETLKEEFKGEKLEPDTVEQLRKEEHADENILKQLMKANEELETVNSESIN